jgi:hypothetical protein
MYNINEYLSTWNPLLTTPISVLNNDSFDYPIDSRNFNFSKMPFKEVIDRKEQG